MCSAWIGPRRRRPKAKPVTAALCVDAGNPIQFNVRRRNDHPQRIVTGAQRQQRPTRKMPHYQLYYMNPVSGHIDRRDTLHAGDDVAAVHLLQGMRNDVPVELWRDGRKVTRQDGPPNRFRDGLLAGPAPDQQAD